MVAKTATSTSPRFSPLRVEYLGPDAESGVPWYRLLEPLRFEARLNGGGLTVEVPANYCTDFASIPRLLWPTLPHDGPWTKAAVIHDYLYTHGGCSRFLADAIFRDAMLALGVPWYHRLPIFYAVRAFGWWCWRPVPCSGS
jgi:hypothetical protein